MASAPAWATLRILLRRHTGNADRTDQLTAATWVRHFEHAGIAGQFNSRRCTPPGRSVLEGPWSRRKRRRRAPSPGLRRSNRRRCSRAVATGRGGRPRSTTAMTTFQLFFSASASAALIAFFACLSEIGRHRASAHPGHGPGRYRRAGRKASSRRACGRFMMSLLFVGERPMYLRPPFARC